MKKTLLYLVLPGFLAALAPVVNNLYSPALPALQEFLATDVSGTQLLFTAAMVGIALGQLIIGPLSDRYGRRGPLLASMVGFAAVSALAITSADITQMVFWRFLQGLTAGGGIAVSRPIATDTSDSARLVNALAFINVINGLMPIVTPMAGGWLVGLGGWRLIFATSAIIALLLTAVGLFLPETLPAPQREAKTFRQTLSGFSKVLRIKKFTLPVVHQAFALVVLFGNLTVTPFLIESHFGMPASAIGWTLAANGIFTTVGAGCAPMLGSARRAMTVAGIGLMLSSVACAAVLLSGCGFWPYEVCMALMLTCVGFTLTGSSTVAMDAGRAHAGAASALLGAAGFIVAAVAAPLFGMGDIVATTGIIFVCAALIALLAARTSPESQDSATETK